MITKFNDFIKEKVTLETNIKNKKFDIYNDGSKVGFIEYEIEKHIIQGLCCTIDAIVITDKTIRNKGLAKQALQDFVAIIKKKRVKYLIAHCVSKQSLKCFYGAFGMPDTLSSIFKRYDNIDDAINFLPSLATEEEDGGIRMGADGAIYVSYKVSKLKLATPEPTNESNIQVVNKMEEIGKSFTGKIEGGFLNKKQADELQKEIESNYTPEGEHRFGAANKDIRQNLFNYDNPLAERTINGVNLRIAEGLIRSKRKTYLLYADGAIIGEFYSVDDIKKVIAYIESHLVKPISDSKKLTGKFKPVLEDNYEIASYIESIASDYVDVEMMEEYFRGCKAVLEYVPINSIKEGHSDHNVADPKKETKYAKKSLETMPPLVVQDGVIEDGNHRYRVAKAKGATMIWVYNIVEQY